MAKKPDPLVQGLLSWLAVGGLTALVVCVGVFWDEDEEAFALYEEAEIAAALAEEELAAAAAAAEAAAKPDVGAPDDEFPEEESVEIPMENVPDVELDPESQLDELVAEGDPASAVAAVQPIEIPRGEVRPAVADEGEWVLHEVTPLETVDQIAYRYGVKPQMLRMWNGIRAQTEKTKPGIKLKVRARRVAPPRVKFEYTVQPGDSWWRIGVAYGVDSRILRAQNWTAGQRLRVGQRVQMWIDPVLFQWIAVEETDTDESSYVRPGAAGSGPPQNGHLVNGVRMPKSDYYELKMPWSCYGTSHAVAAAQEGIVRYRARTEYGHPLIFGSMSARHGGPLTGHKSHQTGRDLDIRLPLKAALPRHMPVTPGRVDWEVVWHLVNGFADTGEALVMFLDYENQKHLHRAAKSLGATDEERRRMLQYPRGHKANLGMVRNSPGHTAHIHVRFTCGPYEPECVSLADAPE